MNDILFITLLLEKNSQALYVSTISFKRFVAFLIIFSSLFGIAWPSRADKLKRMLERMSTINIYSSLWLLITDWKWFVELYLKYSNVLSIWQLTENKLLNLNSFRQYRLPEYFRFRAKWNILSNACDLALVKNPNFLLSSSLAWAFLNWSACFLHLVEISFALSTAAISFSNLSMYNKN